MPAFTEKSKEYGDAALDDPKVKLPDYQVEKVLKEAKVQQIIMLKHAVQMMRFNPLAAMNLKLYLYGLISSKPTQTYTGGPEGRPFTTTACMADALRTMRSAPPGSIFGS
jgi:hypothetical protein